MDAMNVKEKAQMLGADICGIGGAERCDRPKGVHAVRVGARNGGEWKIHCFECRKVCPNSQGMKRE